MLAIAAIACLGLGCAGSMPPTQYFYDMPRTAGEGEWEIVVKRLSRYVGSAGTMKILIDGYEQLRLSNGKIVKNYFGVLTFFGKDVIL